MADEKCNDSVKSLIITAAVTAIVLAGAGQWEHSNIQQGSEGLPLGFSYEVADPFHVFGGLQGTDIDLGQNAEGDRKGNLIGGGFQYIQQTLPRGLDEYGDHQHAEERRSSAIHWHNL